MDVKEFRELLRDGVVNFAFIKKDGTQRIARGTTCYNELPEQIRENFNPDYEEEDSYQNQVTYFDLDKMAWRSCYFDNIIDGSIQKES